jgi:sugar/nucleoside kinase (ribokinase family)
LTYDAIIYGTICLDAVWRVTALPEPGGYVDVLEALMSVGGEATNTALALQKWGAKVALAGNAIARDSDGEQLLALFARDAPDIDLSHIEVVPTGETPYCLCIATPDGNRTMMGRGFTNVRSTPLSPELARSAKVFTMEPNAYQAGLRAFEVARDAGMTIIPMDYTGEPEVNRASRVVQTSTDHVGDKAAESLELYAESIRDVYGPITVVTRGDRGCIVAAPGETRRVAAYRAPEVVDTTGAGDVFRAGLLFGEIRGWDIWQTVEFASAAASLNCTTMGGAGGVKSLEEVLQFQQSAERLPTG